MAKLKPKEKAYYGYFSAAARTMSEAADLVAALADPDVDRAGTAERLGELAATSDTEYRTVLTGLRASFVTPFERTEIQDLAKFLMQATHRFESVGALVHLLDPAVLPEQFATISRLTVQVAERIEESVGKLRKLKGLKHQFDAVAALATETEFHRRLLLVALTSGEYDPLTAVELHVVSQEMSAAVAELVDVAETIETIVITEG